MASIPISIGAAAATGGRIDVRDGLTVSDVALQLPTGSGKMLVGLLIGEWLRRKNSEGVVYLCPTRQLVNQVVTQAESQYGLSVHGFTGRKINYDPTAKAEYQAASRLVIPESRNLVLSCPRKSNFSVGFGRDIMKRRWKAPAKFSRDLLIQN
jgi:DEAD/DEAH box helicase